MPSGDSPPCGRFAAQTAALLAETDSLSKANGVNGTDNDSVGYEREMLARKGVVSGSLCLTSHFSRYNRLFCHRTYGPMSRCPLTHTRIFFYHPVAIGWNTIANAPSPTSNPPAAAARATSFPRRSPIAPPRTRDRVHPPPVVRPCVSFTFLSPLTPPLLFLC